MKRSLRIALAVGSILALAGGYASMRGKRAEQKPAAAAPVAEFLQADLVIVEPGALEQALPLTGSLAPLTEATVKA